MLGFRRLARAYIYRMQKEFTLVQIKRHIVFVFGLWVLAMGFTGCSESADSCEVTERYTNGTSVMTMARLDVSGMMCLHACGGKIKKELLKVNGVANATIEFEEDRALNYAKVEYDERVVEVNGLVEAIAGIADGKLYAVQAVEVTHFAKRTELN